MQVKEFFNGFKKTLPLIIGMMPFGLAYGILGSQAGLSTLEIALMSIIVFAGSSQFMAVQMISQNVGLGFIVLSTFLINLRHCLMGLSLSVYLNKLKSSWLYLLAFGLTDESYAISINHYQRSNSDEGNPWFMLGSSFGVYSFWLVFSIVGGLLGNSIKDPLSWGLDFAMPATFLSILIPQIVSLRIFIVVAISGICAVAAYLYVPGKWYIIIATVVAVIVGTTMEVIDERRLAKCGRSM
jgi:4-azaleucine resistance transporter AzlC